MATQDLRSAYITPRRKKNADPIRVLFNPAEYTIEQGNTFQSTALPGLSSPVTQFVTGNADTLTMELYFDTYAKSSRHDSSVRQRDDVRKYTRQISDLMEIDPDLHAPPVCEFTWGPPLGKPKGFQFVGIIERVTQKFTYFLDDGTPVRATLNVTFKEYKTVQEQLEQIPLKSPDRTKRRVLKEGESLWFFANEEYNDPALWRVIADRNLIENPRIVAFGTELELPPLL